MSDEMHADRTQVAVDLLHRGHLPGPPSALTCPECGGAIWELDEGDLVRLRCHVGHSYSSESFASEQSAMLEKALWTAVRALEEKVELMRRLADNARKRGHELASQRFMQQAQEAEQSGDMVRQVILSNHFGSSAETNWMDEAVERATPSDGDDEGSGEIMT